MEKRTDPSGIIDVRLASAPSRPHLLAVEWICEAIEIKRYGLGGRLRDSVNTTLHPGIGWISDNLGFIGPKLARAQRVKRVCVKALVHRLYRLSYLNLILLQHTITSNWFCSRTVCLKPSCLVVLSPAAGEDARIPVWLKSGKFCL